MTTDKERRAEILRGVRVLDGGLATELEQRGARIDGPLWSAHVLEDAPERLAEVHRAYAEAGADVVATAGYQVSRKGYEEVGLGAERTDAALKRAVEIARDAVKGVGRRVVVAASLGPYGAVLHNGAEYHGNYEIGYEELVVFHRARLAVLARAEGNARPDLIAFETIPSLDEARAIGEAMAAWPELAAWISFQCRDELHVAHGEPLRACAELAAKLPQTVAIGVNCVSPSRVAALIAELRAASDKPVMVYPNSGEAWDAEARRWTGVSDATGFGALAAEWYAAGAQIVGGCCRTRPEHIRAVRAAAKSFPPSA